MLYSELVPSVFGVYHQYSTQFMLLFLALLQNTLPP